MGYRYRLLIVNIVCLTSLGLSLFVSEVINLKRLILSSNVVETKARIVNLLSAVPGVNYVSVIRLRDNGGDGVIEFDDGSKCNFQIGLKSKRVTRKADTKWNPSYTIDEYGKVYDSDGMFLGYFNMTNRPPVHTDRDYDNSIVVSVGSLDKQLLEPGTEESVTNMLYRYSK